MEINVNGRAGIVEIWLTNSEKSDAEMRASLKPVYEQYKAKKYTVTVFESGAGDLHGGLAGLVLNNRN